MKSKPIKIPIRTLLAIDSQHPAIAAWVKESDPKVVFETIVADNDRGARVLAPILVNSGRLSQREALDLYDRVGDLWTREVLSPTVFSFPEVADDEVFSRTRDKPRVEPCILWASAVPVAQRLHGGKPLGRLKALAKSDVYALVALVRRSELSPGEALESYRNASCDNRRYLVSSIAAREDLSPDDLVNLHAREEDYVARERICRAVLWRKKEFSVQQILEMMKAEKWRYLLPALAEALRYHRGLCPGITFAVGE